MTGTPRSADHRPHLLYVAWGYPPSRGSGVYRAWATANAFARNGWRVTVLTAPRETFTMSTGADLTLEQQVDPSIRIVRVPFNAPAFANDVTAWSRWRAETPELWIWAHQRRNLRDFPEKNYGSWRPALEAAARRVHAEDPVDLTIGTANPNVDFLPGYVLYREHGVPYVMDNRDAWQLDIYSGNRLSPKGGAVDRWERRLIAGAHRVWFVNRPIRDWHVEQYPEFAEKMDVVENGYDVAPVMPPREGSLPKASIVFGYIGTISGAVPLKEIVDGWALARGRSPLVAASKLELFGHLNHTGVPHENVVAVMPRFAEHGISYGGPLLRDEVNRKYGDFDALLLTFGAGKYITGGKVYEYAATGLPIVSVHDPMNETSRTLAEYPGWRGVRSMSADDVSDAFIEVAERAAVQSEEERVAAREWARRFERERQLLPWVTRLADEVASLPVKERSK
ncbi:hypothetical protein GCM10022286_29070 [Gryllotalpicola daejeonensis]|uniref:Glycosyltransferase subfamily 4-like N-terminal domain-containing protein n=1 Tax=Gryllotalpicola daejeonensis TaxID=993087 RepID=A0ABP7ZNB3_9MICO